jgi:CBS domain-containing protein
VGILSDRDLLEAIGWLPVHSDGGRAARARAGRPTHVAEIMHKSIETVSPRDSVVTVSVEFLVENIGCLPVVEDGQLVGIVTELDLAKAFWRLCHAARRQEDVDPPVSLVMTPEVITIAPDLSVGEATSLARSRHVRHLPVVDAGTLVGIISDRDLRASQGSGMLGEMQGGGGPPVSEIMATEVITVDEQTALSQAAALMVASKVSALPVVRDGSLVGIVTLTDLLVHCLTNLREPEGTSRG